MTGATIDASAALLHGRPLLRPAEAREVAELLADAARAGRRLRPISGLRVPCMHDLPDAWLCLARLRGVVDWHPHEGTITALAGTPMIELEELAARDGWRVLPQLPDPAGASAGGMVAAGQSGLERLRHGPLRHHLLGARLALPDGSVVKSGSRLVKNVTGYDLHRLAAGARGTTGVVVEASLRLAPLPRAGWALCMDAATWPSAHAAARALLDAGCELDLLRATRAQGRWRLVACGAGRFETCAHMSALARRTVPEAQVSEPADFEDADSPPRTIWRDERAAEAGCGATVELGCLRTECGTLVERLEERGFVVACVDPGLARVLVRLDERDAERLRGALPPGIGARVSSSSPRAAAVLARRRDPVRAALEERLRASLDPRGVLARRDGAWTS
jgi:glycolate oxidase FAD binding subunit